MTDHDCDMDVEAEEEAVISNIAKADTSSVFCPVSSATSFVAAALFPSSSSIKPTSTVNNKEARQRICKCGGSSGPPSLADESTFSDDSSSSYAKGKLGLESLGSELICAICQQLFVEACTIECGHSFCRMCIENWLKSKLSCPICRQPVRKPPVSSLCLDTAVRVMLDLAQAPDTAEELMERKRQATKARESDCQAQSCLEMLFQRAIQQGVRVVHISKKWSSREQQRFLGGIQRHHGVAREAYCKVVGLTYEWVGKASMDELIVAAANVMLCDLEHRPKAPNDWKKDCITQLRQRLDMYIRYG